MGMEAKCNGRGMRDGGSLRHMLGGVSKPRERDRDGLNKEKRQRRPFIER